MCRDVLLRNASVKYCFGSHWRAREAEILVLAARGQETKLRGRRADVLADTSLCKAQAKDQSASEHVAEQSSEQLDSASEHVVRTSRKQGVVVQSNDRRIRILPDLVASINWRV